MAEDYTEITQSATIPHSVVDYLSMTVRCDFDSPLKLAFAEAKTGLSSRVQIHKEFTRIFGSELKIEVEADFGALVARFQEQFS